MTTDVQGLLARLKLWASACITPEQRAFHEAIVCIERQAAELEQFRKDAARWLCFIDRQSRGPFMSQGLSKDQLDADFDEYIDAALRELQGEQK